MPRLAMTMRAVSAALVISLCGLHALGATRYAPIMPLAQRSLLLDIAAAGERVLMAGERGHILNSDDRGASWLQARVPTTQMLTGIHFVDNERGWAVGHDGLILVSGDGDVFIVDFGAALRLGPILRPLLGRLLRVVDRRAAIKYVARWEPTHLSDDDARSVLRGRKLRALWLFSPHRPPRGEYEQVEQRNVRSTP